MISIIIPVFNQHEMTAECISAVRENTHECEIIIVDNGSDPPYQKPYVGFFDCELIRNEKNLGFPVAVNQGIHRAKGDTIVLLNNDVIVTPEWSKKLLDGLEEYSIVGPTANDCAGSQRAHTETYETKEDLYKVASAWSEHYGDYSHEVRWLIGFCMAFRKSLFDEIGDFDESLWPCCGEEIDFCLRAKEKGHRIGIVYGCYVHHEASTTFKAIDAEHPYKEILERNEKHLDKKWGESWRDQSVSASPVPKGICLNLGCGLAKLEGYVNIDNREEVNPDVAWDLLAGIPYADNSVDMVRAYDFLEHIPPPSTVWLVEEIYRVLKPGGIFESSTPDAEHGQAAFQDPHHVSFWVENTWRYFSEDSERKLYGTKANFQIDSISRVESGNRVFHIHVIAKARK